MKQIINYTTDELKKMIACEFKNGVANSKPIVIDGIALHENTQSDVLPGEVFRKGKHRSGIEFEASNFGRVKYNGMLVPQYEEKPCYLALNQKGVKDIYVHQIVADIWLEKESIEDALRRFKRDVSRSGNLQEAKKRQYYLKPSDVRKQKRQEARKKYK